MGFHADGKYHHVHDTYACAFDCPLDQPGGLKQEERRHDAMVEGFRECFLKRDAEGRFMVHVTYAQPSNRELQRLFSRGSPYFVDRKFEAIDRCKDVSRQNRTVEVEYFKMERDDASTEDVLVEHDRHGLRPALYEELIGFAAAFPDEQLKQPIVALGSVASGLDIPGVAVLTQDDCGNHLVLRWCDKSWRIDSCVFLAVRK